ncbi:MAG: Uma2 family endonuclease [Candidatus Hydrothermarchaeota archaeon]
MTKLNTQIKFTYKDYKSLPESETKRYELIEGELIMVPSPNFEHQQISGNLEFLLRSFVQEKNLGTIIHAPLDVHLGEDVVQPDILFISKARSKIITKEEILGAPDLVIEILSPATSELDQTYKKTLYARHGVQEYWIVDPEKKTIEVMTLGKGGFESSDTYGKMDTMKSSFFLGLTINLSDAFDIGVST